ncbi:polysaccharide deacetylase family protein [Sporosarcina sp. NPDC096371]|uniref:polysaccharide deacetylase family protein n=1 Tax=Sporosarcina sp. NPDC096371 TaxID=3364530 RepID=UPI00381F55F0
MKFLSLKIVFVLILLFSITYVALATEKGRPYYEEKGYVLWEVKTDEKLIALTFDDGPDKTYTAQILDLLAQYDAKSTFFVIGERAEKFPDLVRRLDDDGHEIANHTYTHPYSTTTDNLKQELKKTNDVIRDITGTAPFLYRPVGGSYNERMINTAVQSGYKVVMWSWHLDTKDWKRPGVQNIVSMVTSGAKPGNIVLFHDAGGDRSQTVAALKQILPALQKQGYTFVTVSELMDRTSVKVHH